MPPTNLRALCWIFFVAGLLSWQCGKDNPSTPSTPEVPVLSLSQSSVTFEAGERQKSVTVNNSGSGNLTWQATETPEQPWLVIMPSSGVAGDRMTITIHDSLLSPGSHGVSIQFTSNGGDQALPLTVLIAKLSVSEDAIGFESTENSKTLQIQNLGAGRLNWQISEVPELPWLSVNSTSGENAATVTLNVDRSAVNTGGHSGSLVLNSTGGSDTVLVSMSKLPSSVFLDEFSGNLNNWRITDALAVIENGFLLLTGTSPTRFGIAAHSILPARAAPWAFRLAFGRKNSKSGAVSSMVMQTNDTGTITVSAFRFDLLSGSSSRNWQAAAFLFNSSNLSGGWGLLQNDSFSNSSQITLEPGMTNDVAWAMKPSKVIEVFVNGAPFHQSNVLNELNIGTISVSLESVEIWASDDLTTIADWALVRDVDQPGIQFSGTEIKEGSVVFEYARRIAFQQFKDGSWKQLPTLKELYRQIQ